MNKNKIFKEIFLNLKVLSKFEKYIGRGWK